MKTEEETIVITIREARRYFDALNDMARIETLPSLLHFKLARALRTMRPVVEDSEDTRRKLIIRHGKKDKDTEHFSVPDEQIEAFNQEWGEIVDQNIVIPVSPITMSELEGWKAGCEKITPLHTEAILFMVKE
jgi:hypothetical protein